MAGHSKWKNIQHRKGRQDARRGKIFHKLAREIYVAAKLGDPDPANNQKLRLAIAKAKSENMPNENIERAIKKAQGGGNGQEYEEIMYEGYGPEGVAILVESLTDNRNRTSADLRHLFSKHGGNLSEAGSVAWMFQRKGIITLDPDKFQHDEEEILLLVLEHGAEDFIPNEDHMEIITEPKDLEKVQTKLEQAGITVDTAAVTFLPQTEVRLEQERAERLLTLLEEIEEHDDVQNVYANFNIVNLEK